MIQLGSGVYRPPARGPNSSTCYGPSQLNSLPSNSDSRSSSWLPPRTPKSTVMDRFRTQRRVQTADSRSMSRKYDDVVDEYPSQVQNRNDVGVDEQEERLRLRPTYSNVSNDQELFMGVKVRRKASLHRDCKRDYIDVPSHPFLMKILQKQGDRQILFADKVLKFTGLGKMKQRILLITDFAIYIVDPETETLKRRIGLAAVEKMCLSELSDNFFAVIIPTEYDLFMASTRKSEVVTVLVEATKSSSDDELEVDFSNRFEYNAASDLVKEILFEEVEGGVKTRILRK